MSVSPDQSLETRLSSYLDLLERRRREPDPFQILNITRTESPYTHFLGWVLNPEAPHPWKTEFLWELLRQQGHPLPTDHTGPIKFFVESFSFQKEPDEAIGFTQPDIVALSPNETKPQWCLVLENKFDSKEGRAMTSATQCATYEARTRRKFGDIKYTFLFTTRTGERPLGETCFSPVSYLDIVQAFQTVRRNLSAEGKWAAISVPSEAFAYYLVEAFLRHLEFIMPDEDVKTAFRAMSRNEKPIGVSSDWLKRHQNAAERAQELSTVMEAWDHDSMKQELITLGATEAELTAFDRIFAWGEERGRCEFSKPKMPSVVIKIPTKGEDSQILCIQGRKLRFYWVHLIGSAQSKNVPGSQAGGKFPNAFELVQWYCRQLNTAFGWDLRVTNDNGNFQEPSRPLADVIDPVRLEKLLFILDCVANAAATGILLVDV